MIKELDEMTKAELHKRMRYNNKDLRKMKNGTATEYDTMDYSMYHAIRDDNRRIMSELRFRGLSQKDIKLNDSALDASYAAMKALEKKLGY